jgi:hypothetical protein
MRERGGEEGEGRGDEGRVGEGRGRGEAGAWRNWWEEWAEPERTYRAPQLTMGPIIVN